MIWFLPLLAPLLPPAICDSAIEDLEIVHQGATLAAGSGCGAYVLTTDGATANFSYARLFVRQRVTVPFEVTVEWRRLDRVGGYNALELHYLGGIFLSMPGEWGAYTSEAISEQHPLPSLATDRFHTVTVTQLATGVVITIDGVRVGTVPAPPKAVGERVALALKGPRGIRSRMVFRNLRVRQLSKP